MKKLEGEVYYAEAGNGCLSEWQILRINQRMSGERLASFSSLKRILKYIAGRIN
jgi:hypothetical protein